MTEPRFDPVALKTFIRDKAAQIKNRESAPTHKLQQTFKELSWEPSIRAESWEMSDLQKLDLKRSEEIYRQKFGNAADFRFFLVGKLDLDEAEIWIRMQDLCASMVVPCAMAVTMGSRTVTAEDCIQWAPLPELLTAMSEIDENAATPEELSLIHI